MRILARFKLSVALITVFLVAIHSDVLAGDAPGIYMMPVEFQADDIAEQERKWITDVAVEELGAMFWMKALHAGNIDDHVKKASPDAVRKCRKAKCVFRLLKSEGVNRVMAITISRIKRRNYKINAQVVDARGHMVLKLSAREDGGADEIKYAMPGIVEQLFAREIKKNANRVTSIVETTAVTSTEADTLAMEGDSLATAGDSTNAMKTYDKAIERSPGLAAPYVGKAELLRQEGKLQEAIAAINKAFELGASGEAFIVAAQISIDNDDTPKAIEILSAYIATADELRESALVKQARNMLSSITE